VQNCAGKDGPTVFQKKPETCAIIGVYGSAVYAAHVGRKTSFKPHQQESFDAVKDKEVIGKRIPICSNVFPFVQVSMQSYLY
jgi:hypothetical protein